jgi:hypothetical protein
MTPNPAPGTLRDFCAVCGRMLVSRKVRRRGLCGAHDRPPMLPLDLPHPREPRAGERR